MPLGWLCWLGLIATDEPTFARTIAPIVFEHCTSCHRPGEAGPFPLITYDDVASRASQIVSVTEDGYMPPWLPSPGDHAFEGARVLSTEQRDAFAKWLEAGLPPGDGEHLPTPPVFPEGWQIGTPDLVLTLDQGYVLQAEGRDVFRSFVLPMPVEAARFVRAVELRPENAKVVHHAVMMIDDTAASRRRDARDDEPGFGGMDTGEAKAPDGHFLGWTPGKVPSLLPPELAWTLQPGTDLVLQLHLLPSGKPEPVRARIGLYFSDVPPTETPFLARLGSWSHDIPAGATDYRIEDAFTLPATATALGVYPHAHYLGTSMRLWAERPDGTTSTLLRIDDWDFNWQDDYRFATPVTLPAGTTLRGTITYDNSADNPRNPTSPPRRVTYGPESADEMGDLWIQLLPPTAEDRMTIGRDYFVKDLSLRVEGLRRAVERDPSSAGDHYNLAVALGQQGDDEAARHHLERTLASDPDHVSALDNLGIRAARSGQLDDAEAQLTRAITLEPTHANAHANLGVLRLMQDRVAEARRHFEDALAIEPAHANARRSVWDLCRREGDDEAARRHLAVLAAQSRHDVPIQRAWLEALLDEGRLDEAQSAVEWLERAPEPPPLAVPRARLLAAHGRWVEAAEAYEAILARGAAPDVALRLSWLLATCPDDQARDGKRALFWARGCAERRPNDARTQDVLAAALAEAGRWKKAVATARTAERLAAEAEDAERARAIATRREGYEAKRPWRQDA